MRFELRENGRPVTQMYSKAPTTKNIAPPMTAERAKEGEPEAFPETLEARATGRLESLGVQSRSLLTRRLWEWAPEARVRSREETINSPQEDNKRSEGETGEGALILA